MRWFRRKRIVEVEIAPPPRELTGIEKMEIEWREAEANERNRKAQQGFARIAEIRASIQPQLDELERLERAVGRYPGWHWAQMQAQSQGMGQAGLMGLFGGLGGGWAL